MSQGSWEVKLSRPTIQLMSGRHCLQVCWDCMNRFKENFSGNFSAKKNKIAIRIENSRSCNISNASLNCIIHDLSHYPPLNGQFWKLKINKSLKIWLYRDFKYLKLNNLRTEYHGTRYIEKWTREILKNSRLDGKENLYNFYRLFSGRETDFYLR